MAVYLRSDWGSAYPRGGNVIVGAVRELYCHHFGSGIQPARSVDEAMARMRGAQHYHAKTNGWGDIGYSWCVDDLGNIYEARGWWRTGAHTYMFNSKGYGICWLGDSTVIRPSDAALGAIAEVGRMGIAEGAVIPDPTTVAHRDRVPDTACCGDPMYAELPRIRTLLAAGQPPTPPIPPAGGEDDDMPKLMIDKRGQWLVVIPAAHAYRNLTALQRPWDDLLAGLLDMERHGLIAPIPRDKNGNVTDAALPLLGDSALALYREL